MGKMVLLILASSLNISAIIFPLNKEPYDYNKNIWTSESATKMGFPEAILPKAPTASFGPFQGTPVAPRYLLTATHLMGNFNQVFFNGKSYPIERYVTSQAA